FPAYLALRGTQSGVELLIFAWLIVPIAIVCFLSRTGRYETAHLMSSLSLTGLIATASMLAGGITSVAAAWLVVIPFEAALSTSRRVVGLASAASLATWTLLFFLDVTLPSDLNLGANGAALAIFGVGSAALYATGIAFGQEHLSRIGRGLLEVEAGRYRLLARNMTDVVTRHAHDGTTSFVSPAAASLFGVDPEK